MPPGQIVGYYDMVYRKSPGSPHHVRKIQVIESPDGSLYFFWDPVDKRTVRVLPERQMIDFARKQLKEQAMMANYRSN